MLIVRKSC